jgi:hypothetical protein
MDSLLEWGSCPILRLSGGALVGQHRCTARDPKLDGAHGDALAVGERLLERHARNQGDDADAPWRQPDLEHRTSASKVSGSDSVCCEWRTEGAECRQHAFGILVGRTNEDVEIASATHDAMCCQSVRAHNQELDAGISQPDDENDSSLSSGVPVIACSDPAPAC